MKFRFQDLTLNVPSRCDHRKIMIWKQCFIGMLHYGNLRTKNLARGGNLNGNLIIFAEISKIS